MKDKSDGPKNNACVACVLGASFSETEEKPFVLQLIISLCCRYIILSEETNPLEGKSQNIMDRLFEPCKHIKNVDFI